MKSCISQSANTLSAGTWCKSKGCPPASTHSGSAGTFYAGVMIYPKKNIAVVIAINASGKGIKRSAQ